MLNNVTFNFEQCTYGLLGPNGSGKTTLMRCITKLYSLNNGKISFQGADIAIIYALYSQIFPNIWLELIKQVCVITFLFGLVYFVAFLTSSVTFSFMAVVMYVLANLVIPLNNPIFPFYLNYQVLNTTLA